MRPSGSTRKYSRSSLLAISILDLGSLSLELHDSALWYGVWLSEQAWILPSKLAIHLRLGYLVSSDPNHDTWLPEPTEDLRGYYQASLQRRPFRGRRRLIKLAEECSFSLCPILSWRIPLNYKIVRISRDTLDTSLWRDVPWLVPHHRNPRHSHAKATR